MRILYLGNSWLGLEVLKWLKSQKEDIVGLVVHEPSRGKYLKEIIEISGVKRRCIFYGNRINSMTDKIRGLSPDIFLSINFGYILKREMLRVPPSGCINLHTGYLPYNSGANPNVWSIVEDTPAGVTLHYIDSGIDTGPIIAQKRVKVEITDTGETLYRKLELAAVELFKKTWTDIKNRKLKAVSQPKGGTYHRIRELEGIDKIDMEKRYRAKDLINILRARTFPPYDGAYIEDGKKRVYLRLNLYTKSQEVK